MKKSKISLTRTIFILAAVFSVNLISQNNGTAESSLHFTNRTNTAPEIKAEEWINSDTELTLKSLKGNVVLIEFWTFGCNNCTNTIPKLKEWYNTYKSDSFEIIGIHCPEFERERNLENVKEAVEELDIKYPVAIDNAFYNWYNYNVHAWPTIFLIDKKGKIRYQKIGEGNYRKTEEKIKELLEEQV